MEKIGMQYYSIIHLIKHEPTMFSWCDSETAYSYKAGWGMGVFLQQGSYFVRSVYIIWFFYKLNLRPLLDVRGGPKFLWTDSHLYPTSFTLASHFLSFENGLLFNWFNWQTVEPILFPKWRPRRAQSKNMVRCYFMYNCGKVT